jgi:hypothetical protein
VVHWPSNSAFLPFRSAAATSESLCCCLFLFLERLEVPSPMSLSRLAFAPGVVKNCSDRLLARGVAGGNVEEFLGGPWVLAPKFVDQGPAGGPL